MPDQCTVYLLSLGGHLSHYSGYKLVAVQLLFFSTLNVQLFAHECLQESTGGQAWTLLGVGPASGCEQFSCRLEAKIRMEIGGSGWLSFAPNAYLLQKVSKFQLHSQISFLFFCRGTNIEGTCCAKHRLYSRTEEDLVSNRVLRSLQHAANVETRLLSACNTNLYI